MDNPNPALAVKIWRWNMGGLGYSDNCVGADNPQREYEVAMTMDGAINANFIKAGKIAAQYISVGPESVFADGYDPTAIKIGGRNLIIRYNEIPDTMIGENGVSAPLIGSSMTNDFIPVQPGDPLTFSQIIQSGAGDDYFRCAFYTDPLDNASYVIRRISNDSTEFQETVPEGAYWARVSYATKNKVQLERGNKATDWAPAPEEAEAVARAEAKLAEIQAKAYADGKITEEEQARIDQAEANLAAAKTYAEEKAEEAETAAKTYAEEKAGEAEAAAKAYAEAEAQLKAAEAQAAAELAAQGLVSAETQARIDEAAANLAAAKSHAEDAAYAAEMAAKVYAEEKAEEAEAAAKTYAEQKAAEAQTAAEAVARAEAELAEIEAKAYADGKVTEEEQARIDEAAANLAAAKTYAETKASEAEQAAQAYADEQIDTHDANHSPHNLPSYARMESTGFKVYDDQGNLRTHMGQYAPGEFGNWVDAGHYLLRDKGVDMSLVQLPNLISDHSFECLVRDPYAGTDYYDYEIIGTLESGQWRKTGAPKVISARQTGGHFIDALYGLQGAVVNSTNYLTTNTWRTRSLEYYISGFACTGHRPGGTAKIRVEAHDFNGDILDTFEQSFTLSTEFFDYKRVGFAFTVPFYTHTMHVSVLSTDSGWVYWDGIQLVEGDKPVRYEPEENLWRHMFGVSGLPSLGHVVDSGSNSNGSWIRSSGVQICWSTVTLAYNHSGLLDKTWYYPREFSSYYPIIGSTAPSRPAPTVGARGKADHIIACSDSSAKVSASGQAGTFGTGDKWGHHVIAIGGWEG